MTVCFFDSCEINNLGDVYLCCGGSLPKKKEKLAGSQKPVPKKRKPAGSRDYTAVVAAYVEFLHIQGIVFNVLLGLGYFAGGVAAAKFANDWADLGDLFGLPSELETVMRSLAAAAVCLVSQ